MGNKDKEQTSDGALVTHQRPGLWDGQHHQGWPV